MIGDTGLSVQGRCLCGACHFTGRASRATMSVCHCETCRRWAGGALFSVDLGDTVMLAEGSPVLSYASSAYMNRVCCSKCAAPLYRHATNVDHYYGVVQALDDPGAFEFDLQIFIDEKPGNYDFANKTAVMTGPQFMAGLDDAMAKG